MKKQDILEAALDLACEKGLDNLSMSMIANEVHLKKSSLYSHFKSKEELIQSMYGYFRDNAKEQRGVVGINYDVLFEGRSFQDVLKECVNSYRDMVLSSDLFRFYKVILSQRVYNPMAARIMVEETNTMIQATKLLFYALSAKKIVDFTNPDAAALSFAMSVHSIINFECDAQNANVYDADGLMDIYIEEFCRIYGGNSE